MNLVTLFAFVAFSYGLRVKPQLLEAGLPLLVLALHHQVLHAVDETEMHVLHTAAATTGIHIEPLGVLGVPTFGVKGCRDVNLSFEECEQSTAACLTTNC